MLRLLAWLSLLGACSGMLDLPEQPHVETESQAQLEPRPGRGGGAWHDQGGHRERATAPSETRRLADAGANTPADAGVEVRLSSR